jgi:hypothetical protein
MNLPQEKQEKWCARFSIFFARGRAKPWFVGRAQQGTVQNKWQFSEV